MKKLFVVANWKSNKTLRESEDWLVNLKTLDYRVMDNLEIILCSPFTAIYFLKSAIEKLKLPIKLGAQDVSPFPDGAYTGEVTARMLKDLNVEYVLVGHSERRRYFAENDVQAAQKVKMLLDFEMTPIVCIGELEQFTNILNNSEKDELRRLIFMFEPPTAISVQIGPIGKGEAESVQAVVGVISQMKELTPESKFFYGGSVKSSNVTEFLSQPLIDGVVPGTASQNAEEFAKILQNTSLLLR